MEDEIIVVEDETEEIVVIEDDVYYISPKTQEKTIDASTIKQEVIPDSGYTGLSKVTVNGYKVNTDKKTITKNGTYNASDDNLDGYSEVEVITSGVDIADYYNMEPTGSYQTMRTIIKSVPNFDASGLTGMHMFFYEFTTIKTIPQINTSNVNNMGRMCMNCFGLNFIPQLDTKNVVFMSEMFWDCQKLTTVPALNANKITSVANMFFRCSSLTEFGGLINLGQSYLTTASANYSNYTLDLSSCINLTHESLMNVINNLYDIKSKGCNTQKLILGSVNLAKLTAEEIAIATERGWSVS